MSRRKQRAKEGSRWTRGAEAPDDPIVTIAQYGPDDKTATKIVASVVRGADSSIHALKRWVGTDVTTSPKVGREVAEFVEAQRPAKVVVTTGVVGCVHEEGEDYPSGQACPFCPFWKNRDRWAKANLITMTSSQFRRRRFASG